MNSVQTSIGLLKYVTGTSHNQVDQRARALLNAGMLPKSRGRAVSEIDGRHLFLILAAIAMAEPVHQSPIVAKQIAELPLMGIADPEGQTPASLFASAIKADGKWLTCQIDFGQTVNGFTVAFTGTLVGPDGEPVGLEFNFWNERSWGGFTRRSFTLSAEGFEMLRNLWNREDDDHLEFR